MPSEDRHWHDRLASGTTTSRARCRRESGQPQSVDTMRSTRISRRPTSPKSRVRRTAGAIRGRARDCWGRLASRLAQAGMRTTALRCYATSGSGTTSSSGTAAVRHRASAARRPAATATFLSLHSRIVHAKDCARARHGIRPEDRVDRPSTIAVVPAGYADGLIAASPARLHARPRPPRADRRVCLHGLAMIDVTVTDLHR